MEFIGLGIRVRVDSHYTSSESLGLGGFSSLRCIRDDTYVNLHSYQKNTAQFKFNAFNFLSNYDVVYLQCEVAVCTVGDHSSRCSQGCVERSKRDAGPGGSLEEQTEHLQVVGPLEIHRGTGRSKTLV